MQRPPETTLKTARIRNRLTREYVTEQANNLLPASYQFVPTTLTRLENGTTQRKDVVIIAALVRVYRLELRDIDTTLRDEARLLADLLEKACAPWESNPDSGYVGQLGLALSAG